MSSTSYSDYQSLSLLTEALDDLAQNSIEPNVFYEPWMLLPALKYLRQPEKELHIIVVWSDEDGSSKKAIGLFPLIYRPSYHKFPIPSLGMWRYRHCFLCSPLVRRGYEEQCFAEFFEAADSFERRAFLMDLNHLTTHGNFYKTLIKSRVVQSRYPEVTASHLRAHLESTLTPDEYIKQLGSKRRKEFGRLQRRLAEEGDVKISFLQPQDSIQDWVDSFIKIEKTGWKGREGTAIGSDPKQQQFFREAIEVGHSRGKVGFVMLSLNDRPLSIQTNFFSAEGAFSFKIAFDEDFARLSPGLMLAYHNLRYVLSHPEIKWMDSCADPDHPMIDRLWSERREIVNLSVGLKRPGATVARSTISAARKFCTCLKKRNLYGEPTEL